MNNATANSILKTFKIKYPNRYPTVIFEIKDGYLIEAPLYKNKIDYEDPYFHISYDLKEIKSFDMRNMNDLFKAFTSTPIWTRTN